MIIYFHIYLLFITLVILLNSESAETSSIRTRAVKNDLLPFRGSKTDLSKRDGNSLKIISNEPFIIQLGTTNSSLDKKKNNSNRERKDAVNKRKTKTIKKRLPKLKGLRKRHRTRRDAHTNTPKGLKGLVHKTSNKFEGKPEALTDDLPTTHAREPAFRLENLISRKKMFEAIDEALKMKEKNPEPKKEQPFSWETTISAEESNEDEGFMDWLKKNEPVKTKQNPRFRSLLPEAPIVGMMNSLSLKKSDKHHSKDLSSNLERLDRKINNIKKLLSGNNSESGHAPDSVRVRRKTELDRSANKIAKMFLTLSAINGKRKSKCKDEDYDDEYDDYDEDDKGTAVKRTPLSTNEERYKVKKWIEHLKSRRSNRYCPCRGYNGGEEDIFPLEDKLAKVAMMHDEDSGSEESREVDNRRDNGFFSRNGYYPRGRNGYNRNRYGKISNDIDEKLKALRNRGKKKLDLPLDDLETYRSRAKKILQNAEDILEKIKEEEEKRTTKPEYLVSRLKELTSRIHGNPRNNENNDFMRLIQKNLGLDTLHKIHNEDDGILADTIKTYFTDPYEKARELTEESAKELSTFMLRNLAKLANNGENVQEESNADENKPARGRAPQSGGRYVPNGLINSKFDNSEPEVEDPVQGDRTTETAQDAKEKLMGHKAIEGPLKKIIDDMLKEQQEQLVHNPQETPENFQDMDEMEAMPYFPKNLQDQVKGMKPIDPDSERVELESPNANDQTLANLKKEIDTLWGKDQLLERRYDSEKPDTEQLPHYDLPNEGSEDQVDDMRFGSSPQHQKYSYDGATDPLRVHKDELPSNSKMANPLNGNARPSQSTKNQEFKYQKDGERNQEKAMIQMKGGAQPMNDPNDGASNEKASERGRFLTTFDDFEDLPDNSDNTHDVDSETPANLGLNGQSEKGKSHGESPDDLWRAQPENMGLLDRNPDNVVQMLLKNKDKNSPIITESKETQEGADRNKEKAFTHMKGGAQPLNDPKEKPLNERGSGRGRFLTTFDNVEDLPDNPDTTPDIDSENPAYLGLNGPSEKDKSHKISKGSMVSSPKNRYQGVQPQWEDDQIRKSTPKLPKTPSHRKINQKSLVPNWSDGSNDDVTPTETVQRFSNHPSEPHDDLWRAKPENMDSDNVQLLLKNKDQNPSIITESKETQKDTERNQEKAFNQMKGGAQPMNDPKGGESSERGKGRGRFLTTFDDFEDLPDNPGTMQDIDSENSAGLGLNGHSQPHDTLWRAQPENMGSLERDPDNVVKMLLKNNPTITEPKETSEYDQLVHMMPSTSQNDDTDLTEDSKPFQKIKAPTGSTLAPSYFPSRHDDRVQMTTKPENGFSKENDDEISMEERKMDSTVPEESGIQYEKIDHEAIPEDEILEKKAASMEEDPNRTEEDNSRGNYNLQQPMKKAYDHPDQQDSIQQLSTTEEYNENTNEMEEKDEPIIGRMTQGDNPESGEYQILRQTLDKGPESADLTKEYTTEGKTQVGEKPGASRKEYISQDKYAKISDMVKGDRGSSPQINSKEVEEDNLQSMHEGMENIREELKRRLDEDVGVERGDDHGQTMQSEETAQQYLGENQYDDDRKTMNEERTGPSYADDMEKEAHRRKGSPTQDEEEETVQMYKERVEENEPIPEIHNQRSKEDAEQVAMIEMQERPRELDDQIAQKIHSDGNEMEIQEDDYQPLESENEQGTDEEKTGATINQQYDGSENSEEERDMTVMSKSLVRESNDMEDDETVGHPNKGEPGNSVYDPLEKTLENTNDESDGYVDSVYDKMPPTDVNLERTVSSDDEQVTEETMDSQEMADKAMGSREMVEKAMASHEMATSMENEFIGQDEKNAFQQDENPEEEMEHSKEMVRINHQMEKETLPEMEEEQNAAASERVSDVEEQPINREQSPTVNRQDDRVAMAEQVDVTDDQDDNEQEITGKTMDTFEEKENEDGMSEQEASTDPERAKMERTMDDLEEASEVHQNLTPDDEVDYEDEEAVQMSQNNNAHALLDGLQSEQTITEENQEGKVTMPHNQMEDGSIYQDGKDEIEEGIVTTSGEVDNQQSENSNERVQRIMNTENEVTEIDPERYEVTESDFNPTEDIIQKINPNERMTESPEKSYSDEDRLTSEQHDTRNDQNIHDDDRVDELEDTPDNEHRADGSLHDPNNYATYGQRENDVHYDGDRVGEMLENFDKTGPMDGGGSTENTEDPDYDNIQGITSSDRDGANPAEVEPIDADSQDQMVEKILDLQPENVDEIHLHDSQLKELPEDIDSKENLILGETSHDLHAEDQPSSSEEQPLASSHGSDTDSNLNEHFKSTGSAPVENFEDFADTPEVVQKYRGEANDGKEGNEQYQSLESEALEGQEHTAAHADDMVNNENTKHYLINNGRENELYDNAKVLDSDGSKDWPMVKSQNDNEFKQFEKAFEEIITDYENHKNPKNEDLKSETKTGHPVKMDNPPTEAHDHAENELNGLQQNEPNTASAEMIGESLPLGSRQQSDSLDPKVPRKGQQWAKHPFEDDSIRYDDDPLIQTGNFPADYHLLDSSEEVEPKLQAMNKPLTSFDDDRLQDVHHSPKPQKMKMPVAIEKIMKDLNIEDQEKGEISSFQSLDAAKIDHFIDKIGEAENKNMEENLGTDCMKECACADEIDSRSRKIGRYEIVKDFLHWVKDLQMNRVLSDD